MCVRLLIARVVPRPPGQTCDNRLFWTELGGLERVGDLGYECRSSGFSKLVSNASVPSGIAIDPIMQVRCSAARCRVVQCGALCLFW